MEIAYLGLFEKVFNWVLSRIFDPIFKWLSNLLTTVLMWVFNEILEPILFPILTDVVEFAAELLMDIICVRIYALFAGILKLIDYVEIAFDVFIGLRDVTYVQNGEIITGSLLEVLLQQEVINTLFWAFTLAGLGIALALTIYATAKSAFDLDFENKRPVSKVLTSMMKTFITFFTVPFVMYFIIQLATAILQGATYALNGGNNTTLGRIIFMIASLDAASPDIKGYAEYNVSTTTGSITLGTDIKDIFRYPFYSLDAASPRDYGDITTVMEWFDLSNFDYLIGFLAAIFMFIVMAMCLLTFVQRIFEVILLYAVSPYFVSMIPIDEGERFGRWRDLFISKVFTGYGSAIGMRLYLLICPIIMGNGIQFGLYVSTEMDYLMKLFFLIGGAWAVFKSGPMITGLFSYSGGQNEMAAQGMVGGFVYSHTIGKLKSDAKNHQKNSGARRVTTKTADDGQSKQNSAKFDGTKSAQTTSGSKSSLKTAGPGENTNQTQRTSEQTIQKSNISLGSLFKSTYDENGNHKIRVLGSGVTRDVNGNTTSIKFPGLKLRKTSPDGSYKVSRVHIPGVAKVKSNVSDGTLKYSDISVLGTHYHKDAEGSSFRIGNHFNVAHDKDGNRTELKVGSYHSYQSGDTTTYKHGPITYSKKKNEPGISSLKIGSLEYNKTTITVNRSDNTEQGGGDKA